MNESDALTLCATASSPPTPACGPFRPPACLICPDGPAASHEAGVGPSSPLPPAPHLSARIKTSRPHPHPLLPPATASSATPLYHPPPPRRSLMSTLGLDSNRPPPRQSPHAHSTRIAPSRRTRQHRSPLDNSLLRPIHLRAPFALDYNLQHHAQRLLDLQLQSPACARVCVPSSPARGSDVGVWFKVPARPSASWRDDESEHVKLYTSVMYGLKGGTVLVWRCSCS